MMITSMDDSDGNDGGDEDSHGSGDAENDHDDCASGLNSRKSLDTCKKLLEGLDGSYWYKGEEKGFCGLDDLKWPLGRIAKMFSLDLAS